VVRSALPEVKTMKCELCKTECKKILCQTCRDFLKWMYPDDNPEEVLNNYKTGIRRRKRK